MGPPILKKVWGAKKVYLKGVSIGEKIFLVTEKFYKEQRFNIKEGTQERRYWGEIIELTHFTGVTGWGNLSPTKEGVKGGLSSGYTGEYNRGGSCGENNCGGSKKIKGGRALSLLPLFLLPPENREGVVAQYGGVKSEG